MGPLAAGKEERPSEEGRRPGDAVAGGANCFLLRQEVYRNFIAGAIPTADFFIIRDSHLFSLAV